jgi:hypothetical protein
MPTRDEMMKFAKAIEEMMRKHRCNHIDAIVEYCRETGLEIEVAASLVNSNLKSKIESDAQEMRMMPTVSKLPI